MTEESLAAVANWCATSVNRRLATRFADQVDDTLWPHLRRVLTSCRYFTTIAGSECLSLVVANHGGLAAEYHYLRLLVGEATRLTAMRDLKPSPLDVEDWTLRGLFVIVPRPAGSRWNTHLRVWDIDTLLIRFRLCVATFGLRDTKCCIAALTLACCICEGHSVSCSCASARCFLDVSSLNFGGAKSAAVFLSPFF